MQDWRVVLGASVDMRLDACRMMAVGSHPDTRDEALYKQGRKLHNDGQRIASNYRLK